MTKTITLRLSEAEYEKIAHSAQKEHRPISNFITHTILNTIAESFHVDSIEMAQIHNDDRLLKKLRRGHKEAKAISET